MLATPPRGSPPPGCRYHGAAPYNWAWALRCGAGNLRGPHPDGRRAHAHAQPAWRALGWGALCVGHFPSRARAHDTFPIPDADAQRGLQPQSILAIHVTSSLPSSKQELDIVSTVASSCRLPR
ncbi:hypothetical protein VUR80DRAFT_5173 [Thermomyces stellatus]